ncbi:MAG: branched chain amino acid aminotransferase, partial [bacterium]|nr:branched chain amino acid aminotransferase [bacterium]
ITRMSVVELLTDLGYKVSERKLSIGEVEQAAKNGKLEEAFGTGTAAVISPIGLLHSNNSEIIINNGQIGEVSQML